MSIYIKDIKESFKLLDEARDIFRNLNGDSVVSRGRMQRFCIKADELLRNSHEINSI